MIARPGAAKCPQASAEGRARVHGATATTRRIRRRHIRVARQTSVFSLERICYSFALLHVELETAVEIDATVWRMRVITGMIARANDAAAVVVVAGATVCDGANK